MRNFKYLIIIGIIILLVINNKKVTESGTYKDVLKDIIPKFEGFSSFPYWDVRQWSWGYGTAAGFDKAVKPAGTISREKALIDSLAHAERGRIALLSVISKPLSANQWAALLSFSYNLGIGSATALAQAINSGVYADKWLSYNKQRDAQGRFVVSSNLVSRRKEELQLFNS